MRVVIKGNRCLGCVFVYLTHMDEWGDVSCNLDREISVERAAAEEVGDE